MRDHQARREAECHPGQFPERPGSIKAVLGAHSRGAGLAQLTADLEVVLEEARTRLENLRSALPGTTVIAAIHDRNPDHLPAPAGITLRLAAGRAHPSPSNPPGGCPGMS